MNLSYVAVRHGGLPKRYAQARGPKYMQTRVVNIPMRCNLICLVLFSSLTYCFSQSHVEEQVLRVVNGLRPPVAVKARPVVRWTLEARMKALHVPSVSIAVIDAGRTVWARGFGVMEAGSSDTVTSETLFQAQSISKSVSATAALRLIDAGMISLDQAINKHLKSWKLPENEFTRQRKVTLRGILSHSAGITVSGFPGYRLGDSIPSLVQILEGTSPANTPPIRIDTIPGSISRYSGGGYTVMQQLLQDMTGESFPALMNRLVLKPCNMELSTFEQPLPRFLWSQAACGHDAAGRPMKGCWPIQPEMAAAGLWTTPTDLAKWVLMIARAYEGLPNSLISKSTVTEMLTIQKTPFGLGLVLNEGDTTFSFGHSGANLGFRAEFLYFPVVRKGAVVMTNADLGGYLIGEIFAALATEYNWPGRKQTERTALNLDEQGIEELVGEYSTPGPFGKPIIYEITTIEGRLFAELKGFSPKLELFASTRDSLFSSSGYEVFISRDESGRAVKVLLGGQVEVKRIR